MRGYSTTSATAGPSTHGLRIDVGTSHHCSATEHMSPDHVCSGAGWKLMSLNQVAQGLTGRARHELLHQVAPWIHGKLEAGQCLL